MKKTNLLKLFFGLVLSLMIIFIATSVTATDGFTDMTNSLVSNNSSNSTSNNATGNTNTSNSNSNGTNTNTNTNTNSNRTNNTNNSSIYNNSSLPKTGIGDTLPIAALVVVFGISAVYAYKKIKDYKNI